MKTETVHQEILLVTTSRFSKREWCEKDANPNQRLTQTEKLEQACWNGMLESSLPEIVEKSSSGKSLFLWHIRHGKSFLQIELCESPHEVEKNLSIDTEYFLQGINYN